MALSYLVRFKTCDTNCITQGESKSVYSSSRWCASKSSCTLLLFLLWVLSVTFKIKSIFWVHVLFLLLRAVGGFLGGVLMASLGPKPRPHLMTLWAEDVLATFHEHEDRNQVMSGFLMMEVVRGIYPPSRHPHCLLSMVASVCLSSNFLRRKPLGVNLYFSIINVTLLIGIIGFILLCPMD